MSKESITVSIIKTGPLKNSWIFDPNWTDEDIEFLRQYNKPMINLDFEEDGDLFRLSEKGEAELIVSSLRDKMDSYLREGWQGVLGIKDCRNEEEVIEVLEGIENDPETSDEHSAEAFRAYVDVKPICNIINKYKLGL